MFGVPRIRIAVVVAILLGAALIGGGWYFVARVSQTGADLENKTLLSIATTAAAAMEADDVAALRGAGQDIHARAFTHVREELRRLRHAFSGVRFVYLLAQRQGAVVFLADAEDQNSRAYSPPGQVYTEAPPVLHRIFATGKPAVQSTYTDRWGKWASGFAPVLNRRGRVIAIVGFDTPAAKWQAAVDRYRFFAMGLASLVVALIILFVSGAFIHARYQRRVARLNAKLESELAELGLANHIVENSSTVIFRLGAGPEPLPLTYISRNIRHYGYRPEDLMHDPKAWLGLFHEEDRGDMAGDAALIAEGKIATARRQIRFRKKDGSWVWFNGQFSGERDARGKLTAYEGILFDITQNKQDEETIAHLASHDPLTGLSSRTAFVERLHAAFTQARLGGSRFAVLYIDIDHFKDLNDAFGHERGDLLLLAVAERLKKLVREGDTLGRFALARFGGDEFSILQQDISDVSDAAALARRLNKMIAEPFMVSGNEIHATASIGISIYSPEIKEPGDMLMQADLALYRAKGAGRNQFSFHSGDLDVEVRERVGIAEDLHVAIANRELELHYQPQVDGTTGRIVGFEALMRWNHSRRGMVPPDIFIPIAEKTGIIAALGEWAIVEACAQIARWRGQGVEPPVIGVNISAIQLRHGNDLLRVVGEAMRKFDVAADGLEFELTESVLAETAEAHSDILASLRNLGARLAVDDFGTGYSSLQYLRFYPISRIKIAQQFMHDVASGKGDAAIVRATIGLAKAMQIDVIAEGVETAEQLAFLLAAGCRNVQGYYFSAAVTADRVTELLKRGGFDLQRGGAVRKAVALR